MPEDHEAGRLATSFTLAQRVRRLGTHLELYPHVRDLLYEAADELERSADALEQASAQDPLEVPKGLPGSAVPPMELPEQS